MAGREGDRYLAVAGGDDDRVSGGGDGNAGAERAGGEGLIIHVGERNQLTCHGGGQRQVSLGLVAERRGGSSLSSRCGSGSILIGRGSRGGSNRSGGHGSGSLSGGRTALHVTLAARHGVGEGEAEGQDEHEDLESEVRGDRLGHDRHEADEACGTQSLAAHVQQSDASGADGGCGHGAEEGPAQAQVDTEDRGLGDTEDGGCTTGTGQALELGVAGLEENGQSSRALRDVRHGGDGEDEVADTAVNRQQGDFDGREGLVQTGDHDGAVDETEEQTAEHAERRVRPVDAPGQVLGNHAGDGADDREGQEAGDQHRDERGEQEVRGALEDLVQVLLDEAHNVRDGQGRDHLGLVADLGDVHAEDVPVFHLRFTRERRARVPGVE